jgi:hypothetical protein
MGAVLSKTAPQNAVYVFFSSAVRTAGYKPSVLRSRMLSEHEKRNVSHTLSRVVVHEIIHAVAPELPHAEKGLTSPKLTRRFLLVEKAKIDPRWVAVFRQGLARWSKLRFRQPNERPTLVGEKSKPRLFP